MPTPPGSGSAAQPERRRARRYSFDAVLDMEWGSSVLKGRVRDISADGFLIELPNPLWIGARFSAQLALDPPLQVECVVRRVEPGRAIGVTFVVTGEESRARLAALLGTLGKK